jgi:hypothetical protein
MATVLGVGGIFFKSRDPHALGAWYRRWLGSVVSALLLSVATALAQTSPGERDDVRRRINDQHRAAELYRAGNTTDALPVFQMQTLAQQRQVTHGVLESMRKQVDTSDFRVRALLPWNVPLIRALAALHMEAVIQAFTADIVSTDEVRAHIANAGVLFEFVAGRTNLPSAAPAWTRAIGLRLLADGRVGWAALVLDDACRAYPKHESLLVACGTVHEVVAMQPADVLLCSECAQVGLASAFASRSGDNLLREARAVRDQNVTVARRYLSDAMQVDANHAEGRIRLAHVLTMMAEDDKAASLLADMVAGRVVVDAREGFLARLFLGGVRQRAGALDEAAALFEQAIGIVASGQSAFVQLAHVEHLRGDAGGAAAVIDRMLKAPTRPEDPWSGYRFGQHWLVEPLLATLRKEARE